MSMPLIDIPPPPPKKQALSGFSIPPPPPKRAVYTPGLGNTPEFNKGFDVSTPEGAQAAWKKANEGPTVKTEPAILPGVTITAKKPTEGAINLPPVPEKELQAGIRALPLPPSITTPSTVGEQKIAREGVVPEYLEKGLFFNPLGAILNTFYTGMKGATEEAKNIPSAGQSQYPIPGQPFTVDQILGGLSTLMKVGFAVGGVLQPELTAFNMAQQGISEVGGEKAQKILEGLSPLQNLKPKDYATQKLAEIGDVVIQVAATMGPHLVSGVLGRLGSKMKSGQALNPIEQHIIKANLPPEAVAKIEALAKNFDENVRPSEGPTPILKAGEKPQEQGIIQSKPDQNIAYRESQIRELRQNNPTLSQADAEAMVQGQKAPESALVKPAGEVSRTGETQREVPPPPPKRIETSARTPEVPGKGITPLEKPIPAIEETQPQTSADFTKRSLDAIAQKKIDKKAAKVAAKEAISEKPESVAGIAEPALEPGGSGKQPPPMDELAARAAESKKQSLGPVRHQDVTKAELEYKSALEAFGEDAEQTKTAEQKFKDLSDQYTASHPATSTEPGKLEAANKIISDAGMIPIDRVQKRAGGLGDLVLFNHPKSGSTLALALDEVTPESVRAKIAEHEAKLSPEHQAEERKRFEAAKKSPSPSEPVAGKGKQPWEMTREEFVDVATENVSKRHYALPREKQPVGGPNYVGVQEKAWVEHGRLIREALSEGKPVPSSVLKDYPDLVKPKGEVKPAEKAEALTTAKLKEAAEAAPKAGLSLKEQKKTLLGELQKAQDIVGATAEPKRIDALKMAGFEIDEKGRVISDIPGDGTFYTPIDKLEEGISRIQKGFPTKPELPPQRFLQGREADGKLKELVPGPQLDYGLAQRLKLGESPDNMAELIAKSEKITLPEARKRVEEVQRIYLGKEAEQVATPEKAPELKKRINQQSGGNILNLSGSRNAEARRKLLQDITGEKVSKSDAGIGKLRDAVAKSVGIEPTESAINSWLRTPEPKVEPPKPPTPQEIASTNEKIVQELSPTHMREIEVDTKVFDEEQGKYITEKHPAKEALEALDTDSKLMRAFLDCVKGLG